MYLFFYRDWRRRWMSIAGREEAWWLRLWPSLNVGREKRALETTSGHFGRSKRSFWKSYVILQMRFALTVCATCCRLHGYKLYSKRQRVWTVGALSQFGGLHGYAGQLQVWMRRRLRWQELRAGKWLAENLAVFDARAIEPGFYRGLQTENHFQQAVSCCSKTCCQFWHNMPS